MTVHHFLSTDNVGKYWDLCIDKYDKCQLSGCESIRSVVKFNLNQRLLGGCN